MKFFNTKVNQINVFGARTIIYQKSFGKIREEYGFSSRYLVSIRNPRILGWECVEFTLARIEYIGDSLNSICVV